MLFACIRTTKKYFISYLLGKRFPHQLAKLNTEDLRYLFAEKFIQASGNAFMEGAFVTTLVEKVECGWAFPEQQLPWVSSQLVPVAANVKELLQQYRSPQNKQLKNLSWSKGFQWQITWKVNEHFSLICTTRRMLQADAYSAHKWFQQTIKWNSHSHKQLLFILHTTDITWQATTAFDKGFCQKLLSL